MTEDKDRIRALTEAFADAMEKHPTTHIEALLAIAAILAIKLSAIALEARSGAEAESLVALCRRRINECLDSDLDDLIEAAWGQS